MTNRSPIRRRHTLLVTMLAAVGTAASAPPTRVALVADPSADALSDLIAADLHGQPGLQLLERRDIDPVLAEQAITGDAARAVALGRLLSVDLFAVLPTGGGMVVYDARTGVRLADQPLDAATAELRADQAAAAVRAASLKHAQPTRPVCLLTVRNADLGSSLDGFCDGLGQVLQRRLLACAGVTVLERQYLGRVNEERRLPTSRPAVPLLPSLQLLELQVGRGTRPGGYVATVFVSDANGTPLGRVDVTGDDIGTLMSRLVDGTVGKLGVTSPRPADPNREAARFGVESDFFRAHAQPASALAASEAAAALDPANPDHARRLAKDLTAAALGDGPVDVAVARLERVLDLCDAYARSKRNAGLSDASYLEAELGIGGFVAEHREADGHAETLRAGYRDYRIEQVRRWAATPGAADSAETAANAIWGSVIPALNQTATSRRAFAADLDEVVGKQWLPAYEAKADHRWDGLPAHADLTAFVKCLFTGFEAYHPYGFYNHGDDRDWAIPARDFRDYAVAMPPLYRKLAASRDPVLQLCGTAGGAWCAAVAGGRSMDDLEEPYQPVGRLAQRLIADPASGLDADGRDRMYAVWELAIDLFFRPTDHVIDDASVASGQRMRALGVLWDFRKARHEFPAVVSNATPATPPWSRADRICEIHKTLGLEDVDGLVRPVVRDGSVWAIGQCRHDGRRFMQLLRLPLTEGPAQRLGRLDVNWAPDNTPPNVNPNAAAAMSDDAYYLATRGIGILAFPRDGGPGGYVNRNAGLPTDHVDSVAWLDGRLYAGLGDGGYVVRLDPVTGRCEVLASSRRKGGGSPLDDAAAGWAVPCMVADAPRHRILLRAGRGALAGVWQVDADGTFRQLCRTQDAEFGDWCGDVDGDRCVLSTNAWILDWDLRTDRPAVMHKNGFVPISPSIGPATGSITPDVNLFPPYLARDGWLWAGHDGTRTRVDTGRVEDLPELRSAAGHERVVPADVLQSIDGGRRAVVGNERALWLVTFGPSDSPATRPQGSRPE